MADVKLTWSTGSGDLTNIDKYSIYKMDDSSDTPSCSTLYALAAADGAGAAVASGIRVAEVTETETTSYTDTGVAAGTYMYAIFAINAAGSTGCLIAGAGVDNIAEITVS